MKHFLNERGRPDRMVIDTGSILNPFDVDGKKHVVIFT